MIQLYILLINILIFIQAQNTVDINKRVDCYPDPDALEVNCKARGCTWDSNDVRIYSIF